MIDQGSQVWPCRDGTDEVRSASLELQVGFDSKRGSVIGMRKEKVLIGKKFKKPKMDIHFTCLIMYYNYKL